MSDEVQSYTVIFCIVTSIHGMEQADFLPDSNGDDATVQLFKYLREDKVEVSFVKRLLEGGADVNAKDKDGNTLLHHAVSSGRLEVCEMLLNHGADVNTKNDEVMVPLHIAAIQGKLEMCSLIVGEGLYEQNKSDWASVYNSIRRGILETWKLFIGKGVDVNAKDRYDRTPLHFAVMEGHTECARLLMKAGAKVDLQSRFVCTPLHFAAGEGYSGCVEILLNAGAKVDVYDEFDRTPLHIAAMEGRPKCSKLLLKAGAKVDVQDESNRTPLHHAVRKGCSECVGALLEAGADIEMQYTHGRTPLSCAAKKGFLKLSVFLLEQGANPFDVPLDYFVNLFAYESRPEGKRLINMLLKLIFFLDSDEAHQARGRVKALLLVFRAWPDNLPSIPRDIQRLILTYCEDFLLLWLYEHVRGRVIPISPYLSERTIDGLLKKVSKIINLAFRIKKERPKMYKEIRLLLNHKALSSHQEAIRALKMLREDIRAKDSKERNL